MKKLFVLLTIFLISCASAPRYKIVKPRIPELKQYKEIKIPKTRFVLVEKDDRQYYCVEVKEFKEFYNSFIELKHAVKFYRNEVDEYNKFRQEYMKEKIK